MRNIDDPTLDNNWSTDIWSLDSWSPCSRSISQLIPRNIEHPDIWSLGNFIPPALDPLNNNLCFTFSLVKDLYGNTIKIDILTMSTGILSRNSHTKMMANRNSHNSKFFGHLQTHYDSQKFSKKVDYCLVLCYLSTAGKQNLLSHKMKTLLETTNAVFF